ncbi:hypothetical protein SAPIO_CDS5811 [Scedosporium apiospermum]|uniref:Uncharacterized protein n=1 Tax=Pseudallescheria apiosperma TaxID=563466 RepID=A0A084G5G7_PSEDA|nr:uncharacterized protein SAPIO_CDS5811 [Scedosporium apiospermum]KEZ42579.1 hypothetical protein SAPIO_CDS5811 [Scedosporium apiospermum]
MEDVIGPMLKSDVVWDTAATVYFPPCAEASAKTRNAFRIQTLAAWLWVSSQFPFPPTRTLHLTDPFPLETEQQHALGVAIEAQQQR